MEERLLAILFLIIGVLSIVASLLNFDWFLTTRNAAFFVRYLGRTGARIFYTLIGIFILCMSGMLFFK